jgi:hypothetical protein
MVRDHPNKFWNSRPWTVTVTDDRGLVMWEIEVSGVSSPAGKAVS